MRMAIWGRSTANSGAPARAGRPPYRPDQHGHGTAEKNDPDSRRIIVSAWNVGELDKMALAPCHAFFQFYVADGKLSCQLYQRSCDVFLGLPFNIASYALLVHMVAQQCDLQVGDFCLDRRRHSPVQQSPEQTNLQLSREPRPLPKLVIKRKTGVDFSTTVLKTSKLKVMTRIRVLKRLWRFNLSVVMTNRRQQRRFFYAPLQNFCEPDS